MSEWTAASLAVRSAALAALEGHRAGMASSRACVERARALCARLERLAGDPAARARAAAARCGFRGCGAPAPLQPVFAVDRGDTRALVRDLPLRVCERHRPDMEALFRRATVLESVRRKLRARGQVAPDTVRVLFVVVG